MLMYIEGEKGIMLHCEITLVFLLAVLTLSSSQHLVSLKVEGIVNNRKQRICSEGFQNFNELEEAIDSSYDCSYVDYTCINIGQRSELYVRCSRKPTTGYGPVKFNGTATLRNKTSVTAEYTLSLTGRTEVECEGVLKWSQEDVMCGCFLHQFAESLNVKYVDNKAKDYVQPGEDIKLKCGDGAYFPDYSNKTSVSCAPDTDLASFSCQSKEKLKEFDNKVAHFEGNLQSYVVVDKPFEQELTELALCFWLRTKDAVGSIFSLANEDHYNALRFDTHEYHIHWTMVGLHTDHGLVPKIVLQDDIWRYFCANWNSTSGLARIYLRKKGVETHEVFEEILPLSIGKKVRATGGKLALGNLWKEDVVEMSFNEIGSLEGDVMGLTLFNTTVDEATFTQMYEGCSTVLDQSHVVLSWDRLLNPAKSEMNISATFGQQVCSEGYTYGETALDFSYDKKLKLSNFVQNYAKIENAFSIDLTEFTICTIIKSDIRIGTIFSYITTANGFKEEIILEKHKTHMHFYMAGLDQQVGAVPAIPIDLERWYTTCFTWENTGRWRGYRDGVEITNDQTGLLEYSIGKKIAGGGTCYLGIMKSFTSFREYRGYGGEITELNLWGKALTPEQIKNMVDRNEVYEEDLLVNWGTLLENKRGNITIEKIDICPAPPLVESGTYTKTAGSIHSTLYEEGDVILYSCVGATVMALEATPNKTCRVEGEDRYWTPVGDVVCQGCEERGLFECPTEKCISQDLVCDGNEDCSDGSDEERCAAGKTQWIVIGILAAIIVLVIPTVFFVKKARAARAEMIRVRTLMDDWEVKREHLELQDKLGEGAFGKVFKGCLLEKPKFDTAIVVAVKELSNVATERDEKMFLEEIRLSKKLGNHPNIVGIVGSIIVYQPYCLILEYVDGGDILDFLQKNREKNEAQISQEDQVFFAWQIANGMEYVSGKNFVHRDLAARNVLISTSKHCKVTDFGLARDLYNYDEYQSEGGRLPIKWMSPEAIFELKFTTESDVWSFGVLMYELFSWGGTPYPGIDPSLLRDRLVNGFRMSAPNGTPDFIYSIMLQCWEFKSADRPQFSEIRTFIESQINHYKPFLDFIEKTTAAEYVNMNNNTTLQMDGIGSSSTAQLVPKSSFEAGPSTEAAPQPGLEYKNMAFKGDVVSFKNDYKDYKTPADINEAGFQHEDGESGPSGTQYAKVEFVNKADGDTSVELQPVNVGFVDDKGMAEISRSEYMNTS